MSDRLFASLGAVAVVVAVGSLAPVSVAGQAQAAGAKAKSTAATKTWTPPLTPDGQPDLQGVWLNNSVAPLERPQALEGRPSLTDEEVRQLRERADRLFKGGSNDFAAGDNVFLAALADLEQYKNPNATGSSAEMVEWEFDNRTSLITDPPDGKIPPLTPEARQRQAAVAAANFGVPWQPGLDPAEQQRRAASAAAGRRLPAGPEDLSNALRCITWGVPKLGGNAAYVSHYRILQAPGYVVLVSEAIHDARIIPLDGRPPLPRSIGQWNGDSRGRWEGNTLVVETGNFSSKSYFMGSAGNLHLVERFTRTAPGMINYEITLDDPTTWTKSWTAVIHLKQTQDQIYEFACHEGNNQTMAGMLGGARAEEKAAEEAAKDGPK
jgi:hypothetical protein